MFLRCCFLLGLCGAFLATAEAQVEPPDESLTDLPGPAALENNDSTRVLTSETVTAASPVDDTARRGLFRRPLFRRRDSAYVDTLGVGFFNKILAPVYPNPERAAALSFVVPGAGQLYNKRFAWLKVPIIYAGYGALIYTGIDNLRLREVFDDAYDLAVVGEPFVPPGPRFTTARALEAQRDRFDKNYQLSFIGVGIFHLVQTLEAYTTAHLLDFDMDERLTVSPVITPAYQLSAQPPGRTRLALAAQWTF